MSRKGPVYRFANRSNPIHRPETQLALYWELPGDPITDDYHPTEITAEALWLMWIERYPERVKKIYWRVQGEEIVEHAPFQDGWDEDFLTFFTLPEHAGKPLRWFDLPVVDKLWLPNRPDKGGFIQQASGWKPSPLQPTADVGHIARVAGLPEPRGAKADG